MLMLLKIIQKRSLTKGKSYSQNLKKKGKKYDKLIVKESRPETEKRKREQTISPNAIEQPRKQQLTIKSNRRNAFEVLKNRSIPTNATPTENPTPKQKA
ncbi:unnamed protein product [Euphydryas editha]|uniref:Uncharacterized protein n=1 Tax=Euphydryas editha TaxID=104508 RepID=A0AAU9U758_EUPED|nr:unnamed protein product [Euphydryas editha]